VRVGARILGPLELSAGGERVDLRGGKQRELVAILILHPGEVVSADSLIEGLWGERPPPSALKTLQALVSRLRSDLGAASTALETRGSGYRLAVDPERFDAAVFREGVERGRRSLARGDAPQAEAELRAALALWRGPALADFRYEDFAQAEIARLDELRLDAQEELFAAELELGRDQELVVELDGLVREHPHRERLRGHLMLALYRAGRQAEALATFDEGRRALAEALGLEPGEALKSLQRRILEHDPALARPERPRARKAPGRSKAPLIAVALGAAVLAVAAAAALQRGLEGDEEILTAGAIALDPSSGEVVASVPLGTSPSAVAVGEGSVWVVDADDRTVSQIDAESQALVRTFSTSGTPTDIAVGSGSVWIGNAPSAGNVLPTSVSRLDAETGVVVDTIELGEPPGGSLYGVFAGFTRQRIAVSDEAVWAIGPDLSVSRIDPRTNRIVARIDDVRAENVAVGEGRVWVTDEDGLAEIDPSVNRVARRVPMGESSLAGLAVGAGAVWVADPEEGNLWRVDMGPPVRKRAIPLDAWVAGVSFGEGAVWVTNEIGDAVHRVDPKTSAVRRVGEATSPRAVDAGEGAVWLTAASPPSQDAALPSSVCSRVHGGSDGDPDLLIVSSLPLQGPGREWAQPMVEAIRRVLAGRGHEAGPYTVGYQSCDSSTAQTGEEDFFRCGYLAKAFARNLRVVGVFGSFTSPCSYVQIPIANGASAGPLSMLSPSNTFEDLTEDDGLYPAGTRSYFRLATPNRYEGLALVELARQLRHERLFVLVSDDGEYDVRFVRGMRAYAKRVGVEIVGQEPFDADGESFSALVREVSAARPSAVAVVGILTPSTGTLIRQLRAALGPDVSLSGPDGFALPGDLRKLAGAAATGMYVSNYGVPNDHLPPAGKAFLQAFAAERGGDPGPDSAASYGAQGAEILLDAIARSDGTRAAVTGELRRTHVRGGILGDVSFDAKGDLVEGPITILRFAGGVFEVDRVVRVRASAADG
jgi:DNA-binding SARP family transcriptional activator/ABC-type branched-subunit amino acid transport system substrate-binding protein/streptogramin lyase